MFVADIADNGFHQIFNGDQPIYAAIFIHHQRHMHARLTHLQKQIKHGDGRHHEKRPAQNGHQRKFRFLADGREDILDMDHAHNVIQATAIDRIAAMTFGLDQRDGFSQRMAFRNRHDIGARYHDIISGNTSQPENIAK